MRRGAGRDPAPDALAGLRVLLVEDHGALRRILAQSLEDLGAQVTAVGDAVAALATVESAGEPDLLLSDIRLPGAMNGVALADALAARFPRLIVVLQTGYASTDPGHHHVLAKPFDVPDLIAVINTARARDGG